MAKKTKDSNLSIEERLEQVLIPKWDEPHKLPNNWCWIKLGSVCSLDNGYKCDKEELVYLDAKTLRASIEPHKRSNGVVVNKGQKVILVDGENSGEVFVVPYRGYMGSTFKIININSSVNEMYIRYFIDQNRNKLRNNKIGSAIPHLNKGLFFGLKLPLPPLSEQQRIVDRIESLFAKLDEAKEKAQAVVDSYEARKAAILHKAFTGELTVQWRKEHGVGLESWEKRRFEKCIQKMQNGLAKRRGNSGTNTVVLRLANWGEDSFNIEDLREIPLDEKEIIAYTLTKDDVVMIRVNGSKDNVGRQLYVDESKGWAFCDHIIRIRYTDDLIPRYMVFFSQTETYRLYIKNNLVSSAGQNTISRKGMKNLNIPVPELPEQMEIVRILDDLLAKEQQAKETAEAVLEQIDTIKKSILSRAFRGELGTNDPTEESAVELLKQII